MSLEEKEVESLAHRGFAYLFDTRELSHHASGVVTNWSPTAMFFSLFRLTQCSRYATAYGTRVCMPLLHPFYAKLLQRSGYSST